jgi:2-(1,2-epoxy-1,2-dihydrophenyl)acetyl-CoA isomerase
MPAAAVQYERKGAAAVIRLNRPEAGNAVDLAIATALEQAAQRCAADADVRAVVLCGAGPRFCVGGDLRAFEAAGADLPELLREIAEPVHRALATLERCAAVTIAAVHGACAGVGVSFVAACDLAVAERSAFFKTAYIDVGLTPDGGSTFTLPRAVGERRARELVLTNRRLEAREALEWGLVGEVVDDGEAYGAALRLAERFGEVPGAVIASTKELFRQSRSSTFEQQLQLETDSIVAAGTALAARSAGRRLR